MEVSSVTSARAGWLGRRPRVLIVDDDPAIRLLCAATLREDGYDVIQAANGQEGLDRALNDSPDVVLLDISMPVLDGFGLAEALRGDERTQKLPLVFLSGEADSDVVTRAYEAGAAGFFSKPFDPAQVGPFIERVLARLAPPPGRLGGHAV